MNIEKMKSDVKKIKATAELLSLSIEIIEDRIKDIEQSNIVMFPKITQAEINSLLTDPTPPRPAA